MFKKLLYSVLKDIEIFQIGQKEVQITVCNSSEQENLLICQLALILYPLANGNIMTFKLRMEKPLF